MEEREKRVGIKEGIAWNTGGNFIYLFSQWLLTYIVIRLLGYESAGVFSLAMATANSFFGIASYTMRYFQTSDIDGEYSQRTYIASRFCTCAAYVLICVGYTFIVGYEAYALACIIVYTFFKVSEAVSDVYQGTLQLRYRLDVVGISFAVKGIVELAIFSLAIILLKDLLSALVALTLISFAIVVCYDRRKACAGHDMGASNTQAVKALLVACLPMAVYGLLFNATGQVPRIFIESIMGTEALGYYTSIAMPVVIVQVSASFIFTPLVTPLAQYLSDGNADRFFALAKKVLLFIAALSAVSIIGFALLGDWLLALLFGESISSYTYLLLPLVVCTILTALAWFAASVVIILRQLWALVAFSAASLIVTIVGSTPFIHAFGMNGASFVLIVALAVFVLGCIVPIGRAARTLSKR